MVYYESPKNTVRVELGNRYLAALYAWLLPGAGHFYQRRYTKGLLFSITVLTTYFIGFWLGDGRVVYASWKKHDWRWQFVAQCFVGAPTFPALIQALQTDEKSPPLWIRNYRYPPNDKTNPAYSRITEPSELKRLGKSAIPDGFMAAPFGEVSPTEPDVLAAWHAELGHYFDIATLYTFVAGLLNLLVIYDAFAGPGMYLEGTEEEDGESGSAEEDES
ncbi:MAG: hypothetical protein JNL67_14015 [Planctomycetaceae bacterium]|nr:hypothetical protein [Planctomycetaceae bacterium]